MPQRVEILAVGSEQAWKEGSDSIMLGTLIWQLWEGEEEDWRQGN